MMTRHIEQGGYVRLRCGHLKGQLGRVTGRNEDRVWIRLIDDPDSCTRFLRFDQVEPITGVEAELTKREQQRARG